MHAGSLEIDYMSVDVENQEKEIFQYFPFEYFDIKFIVMEVGTGVNWLDMDSIFLPQGYIKVAVL